MLQLACARIGAVHSVVFAGFSAESLAGRMADSKPNVVLCCSAVRRGPKAISLKVRIDYQVSSDVLTVHAPLTIRFPPRWRVLTATSQSTLMLDITSL